MAKSPTILQIVPRLDTGGAELSALEINEALVAAGGRSLVLTEGGRMADRVPAAGGELIEFPAGTKNPVRMLLNARALGRLMASEGVDLVHARSRAPAWSTLIAARRSGTPFVTTYHGAYGERDPLKRLYNSVMARADIVIANSRYTADLVRSRYGTPESTIRVIHRGVDMARFDPAAICAGRIARLRAGWGIAADAPVILQAARLTAWKGQRVLIEAVGQLAASGRLGEARVVLAGDDQGRHGYARELAELATRLGIDDRVLLAGHVDDIAAAFAVAQVAVVASTEPEAFGRAAAEAQALACPVIATDIGAPPETVRAMARVGPDAATGWLVPPGDASALAGAIGAALALSPSERSAMGARARSHIATRFTLSAMRRSTLAVYDQLLGTDLAARWDQFTSGKAIVALSGHPSS
ncbi:MAG: glycosyltransferase family 4 protein [Hyphomicrobiaceae bacterium]|nr:glycosyltransferase family 4 protein [Hyphomicrobiaceae bacterium]